MRWRKIDDNLTMKDTRRGRGGERESKLLASESASRDYKTAIVDNMSVFEHFASDADFIWFFFLLLCRCALMCLALSFDVCNEKNVFR